jgi:hypothetical protein
MTLSFHMWNFTCNFMWNRFRCEISLVICNFMWNPYFTCEISLVIYNLMWTPFIITCENSLVISCEILCHMWFHVKSFHMWNVTCDFMWNPFICEISHVISCEIFSHVKFHIRSHNFTCYHMISHEITRVNSCGFFVRLYKSECMRTAPFDNIYCK